MSNIWLNEILSFAKKKKQQTVNFLFLHLI